MNELFSRYKDHANRQTVHLNRLLEVLQAFGRNPSGADCRRRMHELGEDGEDCMPGGAREFGWYLLH